MNIFNTLSEIRDVTGFDRLEALEVIQQSDASYDFEVGNYRFIKSTHIDEIQQEELSNDLYTLGCFNASFLSGIVGVSIESLELMQKAEAFEGIGEMIVSGGYLAEVQAEYSSADSYGHHFAHCDHAEHEIGDWYAFKVN